MTGGDVILGLASSGLHSNGFSLVRRVVAHLGLDYAAPAPFAPRTPLGEALLTPTRIYVKACLAALNTGAVTALAHITGGGLVENLPRVLPEGLAAVIDTKAWPVPGVFSWLTRDGGVPAGEMIRTFNCGIGMAVVASAERAVEVEQALIGAGVQVFRIGRIEAQGAPGPRVNFEPGGPSWPA